MIITITLVGPRETATRPCPCCGQDARISSREEYYHCDLPYYLLAMEESMDLYKIMCDPQWNTKTQTANDLVGPLTTCRGFIERFAETCVSNNKEFNRPNYYKVLSFVSDLLLECEKHPDAQVEIGTENTKLE